jgi:hypothetical protein
MSDSDDDKAEGQEQQHDFAREEELRREHAEGSLGGCDVEHCQRMRE